MRLNRSDYLFLGIIALVLLGVCLLPTTTSSVDVKVRQGAEFGNLATGTKALEPDYSQITFKCDILKRLDNSDLTVCLGKFYEKVDTTGKPYVAGQYFNSSSTIFINTPYTTDTMMHELYHAVDVFQPNRDDETQAYEFQKLFIQLKEKNLLYAD